MGIDVNDGSVYLTISNALTGEVYLASHEITESGNVVDFSLDTNDRTTNLSGPHFEDQLQRRFKLPPRFYVLSFGENLVFATSQTITGTQRWAWSGSGDYVSIAGGTNHVPGPPFFDPQPRQNQNVDSCMKRDGDRMELWTEDVDLATGNHGFLEDVYGESYTLPYDAYSECSSQACLLGLDQFVAANVQVEQGPLGPLALVPDFYMSRTTVLPTLLAPTWDTAGLRLRYAPGMGLVSSVSLLIDGATFEPNDPLQGWRGITFTGDAVGDLVGTTVSGVSFSSSSKNVSAAVTAANGASLLLRGGSKVENTSSGHGVMSVGYRWYWVGGFSVKVPSSVTLDGGLTAVKGNAYLGLVASGQGVARIQNAAQVRENTLGGVRATGSGSRIDLDRGRVDSNTGIGVTADFGGLVRAVSPSTLSDFASVSSNRSGLNAAAGGSVQLGSCSGGLGTCTNANHRLRLNAEITGNVDARSKSGSAVRAQGNDWAWQDDACLVLDQDGSSTLLISPIVPSGFYCEGKTGGPDGLSFSTSQPATGKVSDDVLALIVRAEEELAEGNEVSGFEALQSAIGLARSSDDLEGAFAGAGRMFATAHPSEAVAAVEALVNGDARPWALGALAVAYQSSEQADAAASAASMLISDFAGTAHAVRGLSIRSQLHSQAGRESAALDDLVALYAEAPVSAAFIGAVTVFSAAFPDVDLTAALGSGFAFKGEMIDGASIDAPANTISLSPNPTRDVSRLIVRADPDVELTLAVYDIMGRRVTQQPGLRTNERGVLLYAIPVNGMSPGTYVVRVTGNSPLYGSIARSIRLVVVR